MKNIKINFIYIAALLIIGFTSCSDDDTLPVDFDDLINTGGPFASEIAVAGLVDINKLEPESSGFSKTYQLVSRAGGTDISQVQVYVSFDGINATVDERLYLDISSSQFTTTDGYPELTIDYSGLDILNTLGLSPDDLDGGDKVNYRLAITNPDGTFSDVSANFDNQSADHTFASTVVCINTPVAGDWILDMIDLYGDGWNGGEIVVNIDGVQSTYAAAGFGTTVTINIPEGTAQFTFTYSSGNWEGENLYTLTDPNGVVVLDEGVGDGSQNNGPREGELLNLCE